MAKAQGMIVLILIIIAGVVIYFVLSKITLPPGEEGSYQPPSVTYSNDIITVEKFEISETEPAPTTVVELSFYIKNNGDETVPKVEANFFSPFGKGETDFKINSIECEDGNSFTTTQENLVIGGGCEFKEVKEGDMRLVKLKFTTPSKAPLAPVPYSLRYFIKYDYFGYRIANIPVVDGVTVKEPIIDFSQSQPTYGPVQLEFEPPIGGKEKVGETIIERYWGVKGRKFKVGITLKHVGTLEKVYPININSIKLSLSQLKEEKPCDFENLEIKSKVLYPDKPLKFVCYFLPTGEDPQFLAQIKAEFNYVYQFEKEQTILVTPLTKG
jgi:hypothetical protein